MSNIPNPLVASASIASTAFAATLAFCLASQFGYIQVGPDCTPIPSPYMPVIPRLSTPEENRAELRRRLEALHNSQDYQQEYQKRLNKNIELLTADYHKANARKIHYYKNRPEFIDAISDLQRFIQANIALKKIAEDQSIFDPVDSLELPEECTQGLRWLVAQSQPLVSTTTPAGIVSNFRPAAQIIAIDRQLNDCDNDSTSVVIEPGDLYRNLGLIQDDQRFGEKPAPLNYRQLLAYLSDLKIAATEKEIEIESAVSRAGELLEKQKENNKLQAEQYKEDQTKLIREDFEKEQYEQEIKNN